ncbi:hypothetical protein TGAMA5MH_06228 [Trichoderma gamsii]|uniref:Uncharacterized protein n=1 Tax=Trichoderma gamsii TaxID=398673 RepID=A0A2K0T8H8_9HYPO|nr:hypothetical protein TGAMA5MH_06228 [Trichoderma gamsii]
MASTTTKQSYVGTSKVVETKYPLIDNDPYVFFSSRFMICGNFEKPDTR